MNDDTRENLFNRIAKKYPNASRFAVGNGMGFEPKRALDAWIRLLIPNDTIYQEALNKTRSPLAAFQSYLDLTNKKIVNEMPKGLGYGRITSEDLFAIAKACQDNLNIDDKYRQYYFKEFRPPLPRLLMHGSSLKGFGKTGSDVDTEVNFPIGVFSNDEGDPTATPELLSSMEETANARLPGMNIEFREPHEIEQQFRQIVILEPLFHRSDTIGDQPFGTVNAAT